MPQLTLNHAMIADVQMDENDSSRRIVKLNVNEEDFFAMLDSVNPKNIIKYLDMRMIPHREGIKINVNRLDVNDHKVSQGLVNLVSRNERKVERARKLMEKYYG